jgi:hypothetical protein
MPAGVLFCAADMDAISPPRRRLSSQLPFSYIVSFSLGRRLIQEEEEEEEEESMHHHI